AHSSCLLILTDITRPKVLERGPKPRKRAKWVVIGEEVSPLRPTRPRPTQENGWGKGKQLVEPSSSSSSSDNMGVYSTHLITSDSESVDDVGIAPGTLDNSTTSSISSRTGTPIASVPRTSSTLYESVEGIWYADNFRREEVVHRWCGGQISGGVGDAPLPQVSAVYSASGITCSFMGSGILCKTKDENERKTATPIDTSSLVDVEAMEADAPQSMPIVKPTGIHVSYFSTTLNATPASRPPLTQAMLYKMGNLTYSADV
ncbi:hypothetical protein MTR67_012705, partial [Solanum verrucosum]